MTFPHYFVSYVVMGDETGSNPMGHACLIFSKMESEQHPIEVVDAYGFYSQPNANSGSPVIKKLKKTFGLDFDFGGTHGRIENEQLRFLDKNGLKGKTFRLSDAQNDELLGKIDEQIRREKRCIQKHKDELEQENQPSNPIDVLIKEQDEAKSEGREPELQPFEVDMSLKDGTKRSYNCKVFIIEQLKDIGIPEEELNDLFGANHITHALPRYSGDNTEPVQLMSDGPILEHQSKRTNKIHLYRGWGEREVKDNSRLYWALPPQNIYNSDESTEALLTLPKDERELCYTYVRFLHRLEQTAVFNSQVPKEVREQNACDITALLREYSTIHLKSLEDARDLLKRTRSFCQENGPVQSYYSPYFLLALRYGSYALMGLSSFLFVANQRRDEPSHSQLASAFGLFALGGSLSLFAQKAPQTFEVLPEIIDSTSSSQQALS